MNRFIVIGAGILGASTAYHLAKAGADVTLIDRADHGQATDAAAGIVCPWLSQRRNKAWYSLAKGGARYYPTLIEELEAEGETDTGYAKVGVLSLHSDPKKLDKMEERAKKRREDAPEIGQITRLSPAETQALFPPLAEEYGSVHVSGGARVNGRALRLALINAAKRNGATYIQASAELTYSGNHVTGVKTDGKTTLADQVIVTAGAWAKELLQPLGINFLIEPQKAQIVHLELPETNTKTWPVVMSPTSQYVIAFDNGRVVVGATHENGVGFDDRVTAGGIHEIFDKAFEIAPGLANSTVLETKVGFRPVAPEFLPIIGAVPNVQGLLLANGLGSSGLTVGPYIGAELAKLALGKPIEIDLELYDVARAVKELNE
ncbi:NAD(P)/FAD-dependent oxidoreductase [Halalkalibacter nanhaiisediminis]|uniref:D-amino-acid dehydrogenase n=1 Tax=Halalkalibacter nanhaiisediminis TaxID=688079 RepID=A0A562QN27_9BACI|nr:FAD-binding oxidoreductase [Halalkalibacter nanhaiisediminis]TWI58162.1 D-amino-acid dehydrogenase [Halalkalibacter nanhaiisediminis]